MRMSCWPKIMTHRIRRWNSTKKAVEAGERALGKKVFVEEAGYFQACSKPVHTCAHVGAWPTVYGKRANTTRQSHTIADVA